LQETHVRELKMTFSGGLPALGDTEILTLPCRLRERVYGPDPVAGPQNVDNCPGFAYPWGERIVTASRSSRLAKTRRLE
ncbi:MAG: hypothetical protein JW820_01520, partial [Spirochaetales bacterium]|nr:hypothetical protein [Spirochaetales bacterium]